MPDPLEPLASDPDAWVFIDVETRSTEDVTVHGAYRHNANGRVTVVAYAVGNAPVEDWVLEDWTPGTKLDWSDAPPALLDALQEVEEGRKWFVAWNAGFEFNAFTRAMTGLEDFRVEWMIDAMVQAMRSHLPADLKGAARAVGLTQKQDNGKALIKLFAGEGGDATPQNHPAEWAQFRSYARDDVAAMRDVFFATLPLHRRMWEEYWASERINHRGVAVDLPFVRGAAALAARLGKQANADVHTLTGERIDTVRQNAALLDWIRYELRHLPEVDRILTREFELVESEDGEQESVAKYSLGREKVEALIAYLDRIDETEGLTDEEWNVMQVLEVRLYGASATPAKFQKILDTVDVDGRLKGQYVYGGAAATVRFCVAADTQVLTPEGLRTIVSLSPGDKIISGTGVPRAVLALIYKGRETLYNLRGPNGESVTCTRAHRIATAAGWRRIDECFERSPSGQRHLRPDCVPVSVEGMDDYAPVSGDGSDLPDDCSGVTRSNIGGRTEDLAWVLSLQGETGSEEPDVRRSHGGRTGVARWSACGLERFGLHVRASDHSRKDARAVRVAARYGSTSHRRQQVEQSPRQLSHMHETGASVAAQRASWTLESVGEGDVWDISVERDQSYLAGGLIHHNSSKGVQIHNLSRDTVGSLDDEVDAIELITAKGADAFDEIRKRWGYVGKVLSRLIRPAFVAPPGKTMVFTDLSSIEAVVCPWLTDDDDAEPLLEVIRAYHKDPSLPDMYKVQAAKMLGKTPEEITKGERQSHGKTVQLALQFLGGKGSLFNMGRIYRVHFEEDEAQDIVDRWRSENRWATRFGERVWEGVLWCMDNPGAAWTAGRITLVYDDRYLRGTLFAVLPNGDPLLYTGIQWRDVTVKDKETGEEKTETRLTVRKGRGVSPIWKGEFVNNFTQATAAALLRNALRVLEQMGSPVVVMHTHDEIVVETPEGDVDTADALLLQVMTAKPDWAPGLPIAAEPTICEWYTKTKG